MLRPFCVLCIRSATKSSPASLPGVCLCGFGIMRQNVDPGSRPIEDCTQLFVALAVALELAVFEFDERRGRPFGGEPNLDFTRLADIGIVLPVRLIVAGT